MKKYILATLIIILIGSAQASDIPIKKAPNSPKITPKFENKIRNAATGEKFKTCVFFTDKGITNNQSLKTALGKIEDRYKDVEGN